MISIVAGDCYVHSGCSVSGCCIHYAKKLLLVCFVADVINCLRSFGRNTLSLSNKKAAAKRVDEAASIMALISKQVIYIDGGGITKTS